MCVLGVALFDLALAQRLFQEVLLFTSTGFLIGGLDECAVDLIWIMMRIRGFMMSRASSRFDHEVTTQNHPRPHFAIFIPAWDESAVIEDMLQRTLAVWHYPHYRIYIGLYPNDPAALNAVQRIADPRLHIIMNPHNGPTTKADCLNTLWNALCTDETAGAPAAQAVILHDAEDLVHSQELDVFATHIAHYDLIQLPVKPLPHPQSRWVAGHYCDEFAEAHHKSLMVRQALGAALPAAGVGCALSTSILRSFAAAQNECPFDAESLTEDYELGLKIAASGRKSILVHCFESPDTHSCITTQAHFPTTLRCAVRQKARWINGIALAGYDRMGWRPHLADIWMRLRDRRAPLAALLLCLGYGLALIMVIQMSTRLLFGWQMFNLTPALRWLVAVNASLLLWRMLVRIFFVTLNYDWKQGLYSAPRMVISNILAILATRRALSAYWKMRRSGLVIWDKTSHIFPGSSVPL